MSTNYADPQINKILAIDGNNKCVDCGSDDPQWASMNNAVFVCLNCAGIHRNLGVEISYIRSLVMDNWDDSQLKHLSIGGNNRFLSNLEEYGIVKKNNHLSLNAEKIQRKYLYVASEYYRELLKSELNLTEPIIKPGKEEGQSLLEINQVAIESSAISKNSDKQQEPGVDKPEKKKTMIGMVGGFLSSASTKVKSTLKKTGEKIDKMEIKTKLKDAGKYVSSKASQIAVSTINDYL
jgi:hypothetical protein